MKHALVIGAGVAGNSVKSLLEKNNYLVYQVDDQLEQKIDQHLLHIKFDLVVKSPGIDPRREILNELSQMNRLYSDLEVASWFTEKFKYGLITGTNGKTTVTECLDHLLGLSAKAHYKAGNIGIPLADIVNQYGDKVARIALECSSFQLEEVEKLPVSVATILNLQPDHLDRYDSIEAYYQAKLNVLKLLTDESVFVLNLDDENVKKIKSKLKTPFVTVSTSKKADCYTLKNEVYFKEQYLFSKEDVNLVGDHNLSNLMIASVMAIQLGIHPSKIKKGIQTFYGVAHRLEFVGEDQDNNRYYNDSKATNPKATLVAMSAFKKNVHLILGGYDKQIAFDELKTIESKCKYIYVFGQTKQKLKTLFPQAIECEDLQSVLNEVLKNKEQNEDIVFSPACASYDQFKNYVQRGNAFKELVSSMFLK